jgi:BrnA antitoxin of type II toxin-antitoxin system
MKGTFDFSHAKRGPILPVRRGKSRITIRLDDEVLDWFRARVHAAGGGSYQTLINDALRTFVAGDQESLEAVVRRVVRAELRVSRRAKRARAA